MGEATGQLFDIWKKQLDEGAQAWARLLSQSPAAPPDPTAFWRPMMDQWVQSWARIFAQTPMSPDVMGQWKQFLDQSIEAWSRAMGQAMNTDAFAQLLGRYLDQWLVAYAPARKLVDQSLEGALQTLNLASRTQLTGVARQIVELDERIERLEDAVNMLLRRLDDLARAPAREPKSRSSAPSGERA